MMENARLRRTRDALLIVRYQAGDDAALERLIELHARPLRSYVIRRLGGDVVVVDDVLQDVWFQVLRGLGRIRDPMTFQAWLNRIAANQVALFLRKKNRPAIPLDAVAEPCREERSQVVDLEEIRIAIDRLEPNQQALIRMRFWESRSYHELAEHLQVPIGTVRSRLHTARKKLLSILSDREAKHVTK